MHTVQTSTAEGKAWDEVIWEHFSREAIRFAQDYLSRLDDELAHTRDSGFHCLGFRTRVVLTRVGFLTLHRRLYHDPAGKSVFLLDRFLGLASSSLSNPTMAKMIAQFVSFLSYRQTQGILGELFPGTPIPSPSTLQRFVGRLGQERRSQEETECRALWHEGALPDPAGKDPPVKKKVPLLLVEADGLVLPLQRDPRKKRAEIKLAFSYEGWEKAGRGNRFVLQGKTATAGFRSGDSLWQDLVCRLDRRYDLPATRCYVLGGDGASWIRQGLEYLTPGLYQLDRFHLKRAIGRVLPFSGSAHSLYQAALTGNLPEVNRQIAEAQRRFPGKRDELEKLRCYLRENADGLTDYRPRLPAALRRPDLRGLGGAEGNIAQLLAHRFTGRGMSWSVNGADRLASLIMLGTNGELGRWLAERREGNDKRDLFRPHDIAPLRKRSSLQKGTLPILAGLPVLEGPHQSRPWVQKIRQLSHIQGIT
jgi:hypothetical protein